MRLISSTLVNLPTVPTITNWKCRLLSYNTWQQGRRTTRHYGLHVYKGPQKYLEKQQAMTEGVYEQGSLKKYNFI